MLRRVLTTFEAARCCGVDPHTVRNWILAGKLAAYTTPGGHRRIRKEDLDAFLEAHSMPLLQEFSGGGPRILLAGPAREVERLARRVRASAGGLSLRGARDGFSLAWELLVYRPHLLLLWWEMAGVDAPRAVRRARSSPETSGCRVVVAASGAGVEMTEAAVAAGARAVLARPVDPHAFLGILRELFPAAVAGRRPSGEGRVTPPG